MLVNSCTLLYGMLPVLLVVAIAKSLRSHNKILPELGNDCFLHNFCQCNINESSHLLAVWSQSYWHIQTRRQRKVMTVGDDAAAAAANGLDNVASFMQVWGFHSCVCNRGFWSPGMGLCIIMRVISDVLKECTALILKGQDDQNTFLWNVRNRSPNDTVSYSIRPEFPSILALEVIPLIFV